MFGAANRHLYFYPRPPRGGRLRRCCIQRHSGQFLSTPSARRATQAPVSVKYRRSYFYPRPPRGGRRGQGFSGVVGGGFLSTPSARRATNYLAGPIGDFLISIHALREEGDFGIEWYKEGGILFLSTPSARRATCPRRPLLGWLRYFYPRPPRGGRRINVMDYRGAIKFLSTPSARRATEAKEMTIEKVEQFLSTPSARRATKGYAGSWSSLYYFYPRPPRGGRRVSRPLQKV